ncbi:hypothetical protein [Phytoactinopolyspora endophytica]|uniref:hypothetical protein n=1 Tax=Phytoactinopolyspora endophytica TaxID=1642495 RepID=UPI00101DD498|nr:hypothetical protein [Phytoactinopolyspora endophytica]
MYGSHVVDELAGYIDWLAALPTAANDAERLDRIAALEKLLAATDAAQATMLAELGVSQQTADTGVGIETGQAGPGTH